MVKRFKLDRRDVEMSWVNNSRDLIRLRMLHRPTEIVIEGHEQPQNPKITSAQLGELRKQLEQDLWNSLTDKVAVHLRVPGR